MGNDMNNKPVAIVNTNCENNIQWYDDNPKQHNGYFLYTHPVKELTDEEIENIAENCWKTDEDLQFFDYNKFAKAILRKAQEK